MVSSPPPAVSSFEHLGRGGLLYPVLTDWRNAVALVHGQLLAGPVAPDGTAVEQVLSLPTQAVDQGLLGVEGERDEVDDRIRRQLGDPARERTLGILSCTVRRDVPDLPPGGVVDVARTLPTADVDHLVAGADQTRDEEGADVAAAPDDDDAHGVTGVGHGSLTTHRPIYAGGPLTSVTLAVWAVPEVFTQPIVT